MATLAVNLDEDNTESCIVVADRTAPRARTSNVQRKAPTANMKAGAKSQAQSPATPKRPRGRPKKPRSNTADTAIVLSDSEAEDDSVAHREQSRDITRPGKRSLTKLDTPTPAPNPKRSTSLYTASAASQPVTTSSMRAAMEQLQQQLASEKKLRADAEARKAELEGLLDEKDASWAADLAARTTPLQLQLQHIGKQNKTLDAACKDLETRLQVALDKNQEHQASSLEGLAPTTPNKATEANLNEKDALITGQAAEIKQLKKAEVSRATELTAANEKVGALTKELGDLTTRHTATTKMMLQHESRIKHLTDALSAAKNTTSDAARIAAEKVHAETKERLAHAERDLADKNTAIADLQRTLSAANDARVKVEGNLAVAETNRRQAEGKLKTAEKDLALVDARRKQADDKMAQQLAAAVNKRKQAEDELKAKEQQLGQTGELLAKANQNLAQANNQLAHAQHAVPPHAQETINSLSCERSALLRETEARLKEMGALQKSVQGLRSAVAALEQEKQKLGAAVAEKNELQKKLTAHKGMVSTLQRERQQLEAAYRDEVTPLKQQFGEQKKTVLALRAATDNASKQIDGLNHELDHYKDRSVKLQQENQGLRSEYEQLLQKATSRETQFRDRIAQTTNDLAARDAEVQQLRQHLAKQGLREDTLEKDSAALNAKLVQLEAELKEKHTVVVTQKQEVEKLRASVDTLRADVTKLEAELAAQREESQQRTALLADKEKDLTTKRSQIQQLKQTISALTTEKTSLMDDLTTQKNHLQQLSTQLTQLTTDNESLKSTLTTTDETIASLRHQLFKISHEKDALNKQTTTAQSELTTLQTELSAANKTIDKLTQSAAIKEHATDALRHNLQSLNAKQTAATELITSLESELSTLKSQLADSGNAPSGKEIANLRERVADLTEANKKLEGEREAQGKEVEKLRGKLAEMMAEGEALEEYLAKRDGCVERMREWVRTLPEWMESALARK